MVEATTLPTAELPPISRGLVRLVRTLCALGAVMLTVLPAWFWSSPTWVAQAADRMAGVHEITLDADALRLGALVGLLPMALGLYLLWQLWRLFGEYGAGRVFTPEATLRLRRFAWAVLALVLQAPLLRAVLSVVLTLGNPPGRRQLVLGFGSDDYIGLLLALVLIAIATVMAEAVRIAQDHEGFV